MSIFGSDIDVISSNTKFVSPWYILQMDFKSSLIKQLPILSKYIKPPVICKMSIDKSQSDKYTIYNKNINTTRH